MTTLDQLATTDHPQWREQIDQHQPAETAPAERVVDGHPKDAVASPTE